MLHLLLRRKAFQYLFSRLKITHLRFQLGKINQYLQVLGILLVHLRQDGQRSLNIALFPDPMGLVIRILLWRFNMLVQNLADFVFRQRTVKSIHRLAILDQNDRWQTAHTKAGGKLLLLVRVHLGEHERALVILSELFQQGHQLLARSAPLSPDIDQNGCAGRGFHHLLLKVFHGSVKNIRRVAHARHLKSRMNHRKLPETWGQLPEIQAPTAPTQLLEITVSAVT